MSDRGAEPASDPLFQQVYGLTLASPFVLPGGRTAQPGQPDLIIREGAAQLSAGAETRGPYRFLDGRLELAIPDAGRFLLHSMGLLQVSPTAGVDAGLLSAFLVASGMPMLLWQRGGLLLHASGIQYEKRVIALCGPSGIGKTTLARMMLDRGGNLLGDDSLWFPDPASPNRACGLAGGQFRRDPGNTGPAFHPVAPERQVGEGELSALFVLSASPIPPARLGPVEAVQAVLRARHRPLVPELLGRYADVLDHCVRLAARIRVYRIPVEPGRPEATLAAIDALSGEMAV